MENTADKKVRRLFLFAAYDPLDEVGTALLYYLKALSDEGDVVLCADSDIPEKGLEKLERFVVHAEAGRHGEYDFGSYKRCWKWITCHLRLEEYDYLYLVNDSVYGPVFDIGRYLNTMERSGNDAFAMAYNPRQKGRHMQSWFIGMHHKIFTSTWFGLFFDRIIRVKDKAEVCIRYETGLTELMESHNVRCGALFKARGKSIYNRPLHFFRAGMPFVKKSAFTRHGGSLGRQLALVFEGLPAECRESIEADINRIYGETYLSQLLTLNPFKTAFRYLRYLKGKIRKPPLPQGR